MVLAATVATLAGPVAEAPAQSGGIHESIVQPGSTGPGITVASRSNDYDYVWQAAPANRLGVLLVFLGGTDTGPGIYQDFGNIAAEDGFDVIDLSYPDSPAVGTTCADPAAGETPDECFTSMRGTILFGQGSDYGLASGEWSSPDVNVDEANSIVNRLVSLLGYKGWTQYLQSAPGTPYGGMIPKWSQIVMSGHSQGSGEAAFLATRVDVRRVVTISGPDDWVTVGGTGQPASWITGPSATPASAFYGLRNSLDGSWSNYSPYNWTALGYPGSLVDVDTTGAPYDDSHQLYTEMTPPYCANTGCTTLEYHAEPVVDGFVPLNALGVPVLAPVWTYMITGNGTD